MRHIVILMLLISVFCGSCSKDEEIDMDYRGFNEEKLAELKKSKAYDYDRVIERSDNPVLKFFANIFVNIARLFGSTIGYILIVLILALLVYVIVKNSNSGFFEKRAPKAKVVTIEDDTPIDQVDFDALLRDALSKADFRLAIRYTYLRSLNYLQQAELIQWNKDKTNYEYMLELPAEHRSAFSGLSSIYEFIWYGHFGATEEIYQDLTLKSDHLIKTISAE